MGPFHMSMKAKRLPLMNSSGIVTYRGVTYVVAIYSDRDATLEEGQEIVEHVADRIATALLDAD